MRVRARLDLTKVDAQPAQVRQVEAALQRLLAAGFAEAAVQQHAQRKLGEANTCKYLLTGLAPEHVVEVPATAAGVREVDVPQWCGECDREGRDKPGQRRIEAADGSIRRCPNCHPEAAVRP